MEFIKKWDIGKLGTKIREKYTIWNVLEIKLITENQKWKH